MEPKERTSATHPIRVDFVELPPGMPGKLGLTLAPGKQEFREEVHWKRDLQEDLERLRTHHQATVLVTLMERHELEKYGILPIFDLATKIGLHVHWTPMVEFSTPPLPSLVDIVKHILAAMKSGGTVVVHCRGGLGRTGVVTAACLVALGVSGPSAIETVRRVRPKALETAQQEAFIRELDKSFILGASNL